MLLGTGMREQHHSQLRLDGVDHAVVQEFVRFLYTGEVEQASIDDQDMVCHLLAVGHRYEVASLVKICSAHIALSEQLELSELKAQVMDYICSCRARIATIQGTEDFGRLAAKFPKL